MNWQEILIRFLISGAAGAATTGAVVMSAENAPKLRRKKKRKRRGRRRRRRPGDPPPRRRRASKEERARKKARDKRRKEAEAAVSDPGGLAIKHLAETSEPGLSTDQFLVNLKGTGRSMKDGVGRLFGLGPPPTEPAAEPEVVGVDKRQPRPSRREERDRARGVKSGRRRRKQTSQDGLDALKQDVMYLAKDGVKKKVKQTVVDATGMGEGVGKITDFAEGISERASDVAGTIGGVAKEGAGRLTETAGSVAKNAGELASSVRENLPEDVEAVGDGMKGIGRWLQGPGAQNYDGERGRRQLTGAAGDVVDAKTDVVKAKLVVDPPIEETAPAPPPIEAGPFRPAEEVEHDASDDKRWATVEPGAPGDDAPVAEAIAPVIAQRAADTDHAEALGDVIENVDAIDRPDAMERTAPAEEGTAPPADAELWQVDTAAAAGPAAGEVVDAELMPAPDDDVVEARVDDDAPPPVRRHRG